MRTRALDALAHLEAGDAFLFHVSTVRRSARSLIWVRTWTGPPGNSRSASPAGNASWRAAADRAPGPAVEYGLGGHGVGQTDRAAERRDRPPGAFLGYFGAHEGKYRCATGLPHPFPTVRPCDTYAASQCARIDSRAPSHAWKEAIEVQVLVRENNVDQALRVLKKKMQREGIFREMKLRRITRSPPSAAPATRAEAIRRTRKLMRKRMEREGY